MGILDSVGVQYKGLEAPAVALDNPEEWTLLVFWVEMTNNGTILWTRRLMRQCTLWHDRSLCLWCREDKAWET